MIADGTDQWGFLPDDDVAAVGALPHGVAFFGEDQGVFHIVQKGQVALLMLLLDLAYHFKQGGDAVEAFLPGLLGEGGVHIRPFVIFAAGGVF